MNKHLIALSMTLLAGSVIPVCAKPTPEATAPNPLVLPPTPEQLELSDLSESSATQDDLLFSVLPEGEELSSEEMSSIEGEWGWIRPRVPSRVRQVWQCVTQRYCYPVYYTY